MIRFALIHSAVMLLQLHNGTLEGCRTIPKGYILMDETDWYRLYMAPVVDKLPPSKTYLPFPGLLWGTPVVDLFGVDNEEAAKSIVTEKASAIDKLWRVWKTPHHVSQVPPKRTKKGDTTRKRSRKGTKELADGDKADTESESEVTDTEKDDRSYIESEGDKPEDDADVSESDVCETDDEYVYDSPFDSDDNEEHCEEDPPDNAVDLDVDDTVDSDDE